MALGFIDLEDAYDAVPRETVAKLRWMGILYTSVETIS